MPEFSCSSLLLPRKETNTDQEQGSIRITVSGQSNTKLQGGIPGEGVQGLNEVVAVALIFLSALQQGSSSMHHVTGQEAVLKAEVNAKCLDTDVIHTDGGGGGFRLSVNVSESNKPFLR